MASSRPAKLQEDGAAWTANATAGEGPAQCGSVRDCVESAGGAHREDCVDDLAVGSTVCALLHLGVVQVKEVVEPGEELALANEEGGVHHTDCRHLGVGFWSARLESCEPRGDRECQQTFKISKRTGILTSMNWSNHRILTPGPPVNTHFTAGGLRGAEKGPSHDHVGPSRGKSVGRHPGRGLEKGEAASRA